jgi:hypothetical protein
MCLALATVFERLEDHKIPANRVYRDYIFAAKMKNTMRDLFFNAWLFPRQQSPNLAAAGDQTDNHSKSIRHYRWYQAMCRVLLTVQVELEKLVNSDASCDIIHVVLGERAAAFRPKFDLIRDKYIPTWLREVTTPAIMCEAYHDVGLVAMDHVNTPQTMISDIISSVCGPGLPDCKRYEAHSTVQQAHPTLLTGQIPRHGPSGHGDYGASSSMAAYFSNVSDLQQVRRICASYAIWFEGLTAHTRIQGLILPAGETRGRPPGSQNRPPGEREESLYRSTDFDETEGRADDGAEALNLVSENSRGKSTSSPTLIDQLTTALKTAMQPTANAITDMSSRITELDKRSQISLESRQAQRQLMVGASSTSPELAGSATNPPRPKRPADLRPIVEKYPINDYNQLLPAHKEQLKQYGIPNGNHPRYQSRQPGCPACGSQYHPVGWCPSLLAFTKLAAEWKEAYRRKLQERLSWQAKPTLLQFIQEAESDEEFETLNRLVPEVPRELVDTPTGLVLLAQIFDRCCNLEASPQSLFCLRSDYYDRCHEFGAAT